MTLKTLMFALKGIGLSKLSRKPSTLIAAARHNKRQLQPECGKHGLIDATRTHLNECLAGAGTAEEVVVVASALMAKAKVQVGKLRHDYCQAIEFLFSLHPAHILDESAYFTACVRWLAYHFGEENLLSADIHRDEAAPHLHVLLMPPIVDGKLCGSRVTGKAATAALLADFVSAVGEPFGLRPPQPLNGQRKALAARLVLDALQRADDPILRSALWPCEKASIEGNPGKYLEALGMEEPVDVRSSKTMAAIFTSPGKGARREQFKPYGLCKTSNPLGQAAKPITSEPIEFANNTAHDGGKTSQSAQPPLAYDSVNHNYVDGTTTGAANGVRNNQTLSCVGFCKGFEQNTPINTAPRLQSKPALRQASGHHRPNHSSHGIGAGGAVARRTLLSARLWIPASYEPPLRPADADPVRDDAYNAGNWCADTSEFRAHSGP